MLNNYLQFEDNENFFQFGTDYLKKNSNCVNKPLYPQASFTEAIKEIKEKNDPNEITFKFDFPVINERQWITPKQEEAACEDECSSWMNEFSYSLGCPFDSSDSSVTKYCSNDSKSNSIGDSDSCKNGDTSFDSTPQMKNLNTEAGLQETDLNKLLDDVILAGPTDPFDNKKRLHFTKKNGKRRMRKSIYQIKILKQEFKKNNYWTKEDMIAVGKKSGLEHSQVYKWYWEQRKRK